MGAPKLKKEKHKVINKKQSHLKLVEDEIKTNVADKLEQRQRRNQQEKMQIKHFQDIINKSLEDPEMVKKAAMLLLNMLEEK